MIGSGRVVCMVGLQKFVGCTDHQRLVACLSTYPFDPRAHRGIGNVPEVPRYQIIDAVRDGDDIGGIGPRRATPTLPMHTSSRQRGRWEALSPQPWESALMLRGPVPAGVHALTDQLMIALIRDRHAGSLSGNGFKRERNFVFDEPNVFDGGSCQNEVLGNFAGDDDASDRGFTG